MTIPKLEVLDFFSFVLVTYIAENQKIGKPCITAN